MCAKFERGTNASQELLLWIDLEREIEYCITTELVNLDDIIETQIATIDKLLSSRRNLNTISVTPEC